MDLKKAKDNVIYKVGLNVLLFQEMEHLLKFLVMNGQVSGYASEILSKHQKRKTAISKQTLGTVAGSLLNPVIEEAPEVLKEAHISFNFSFETGPELASEIEGLVAARNHLVHHFLTDIDMSSVENLQGASESLDAQEERLRTVIDQLRSVAKALQSGRKEMAEYMMTEEFRKRLTE